MNALANSTSPYLLQHANNPVNWFPWGNQALQKAKNENKLLLISIGYSACHWCHVMERESFEDEEIATVMNKFFVCIKVDREERPDIDQVYMEAVQLMSGQGGWPLNCIALPDQKPIYGGTYFPKENWREVLLQLAKLWEDDPDKCRKYAEELTEGVRKSSLLPIPDESPSFNAAEIYKEWSKRFDHKHGGMQRAPKFPMPDNYQWLLHYAAVSNDESAAAHAKLTLHKMAAGGLYDQLGGGFARYSTDNRWKVPHFEKMLYDNAQLITLYTRAWQYDHDPMYERVVRETIEFVQRELTGNDGAFYSALDADSEGVEGLFYIWTKEEIENAAGENAGLFKEAYSVNETGFWEDGRYILMLNEDSDALKKKYGVNDAELDEILTTVKSKLMQQRNQRIRPGLDDKILCNWNALMLKACAEAGRAFKNDAWIKLAEDNAIFLLSQCSTSDGRLLHSVSQRELKSGLTVTPVPGFLDDYAFLADALVTLYSVTFEEHFFKQAERLVTLAIEHFNADNLFFYYTPDDGEALITRRIELQDNVTPSSNSVMAFCLYTIGVMQGNTSYVDRARAMVNRMQNETTTLTQWYSNWARLAMMLESGTAEVVFAGPAAIRHLEEWMQGYHPAVIVAGAAKPLSLELLVDRIPTDEKTLIYVCRNGACQLPVSNVKEALAQL